MSFCFAALAAALYFFSIGFSSTIFSIEKNNVLQVCWLTKSMTEKNGATTHDAPPSSAGHSRAVRRAVLTSLDDVAAIHFVNRQDCLPGNVRLNSHNDARPCIAPVVNYFGEAKK